MPKAERLPSGNYRIRVYVGSEMKDGKRIRHYETFTGPNKKLLELEAARFAASNKPEGQDITFAEALSGYIASKENILSPSTVSGYRNAAKNYFEDIKNKRILKITQKDVQAMMNKYAENLSPKTCKNIHGLFSAVMKMYAPEKSFYTKLPQKKKQEIHIPSSKDIQVIKENLRGTRLLLPFLLATQLGLRASEIAGLQKSAVNKKENTITISQAMVNSDNGAVMKAPKSYSGYRVLHANDELIKQILDSPYDPVTGMTSHRISSAWSTKIKTIPVEPFSFHKLRHYFASQAMLQGIPMRYIAEMMGHDGTQMLEEVYLHTFPAEKAKYSAQMADFFAKKEY